MKANMTKKIFGIVLAVMMLMTILPVAAMAAEGEVTVYLKPNANWASDGARFAVYYFGGAGDGWVDMTADGDYFTANVPAGTTIIFCRMNPGTTENNWDNRWNQTNDLPLPTDNSNCYTVEEGAWSNGNGAWSEKGQDPTFTPVEEAYYVAGEGGLCGENNVWNANPDTALKMTKTIEGLYELELKDIEAGTYQFKVTMANWSKDWGDSSSENGNYWLTLEEKCNVKIIFNVDTQTITVSTEDISVTPDNPSDGDTFLSVVMVTAMAMTALVVLTANKKKFL